MAWSTLKKIGETAADIGTLGAYSTVKDIYGTGPKAQAPVTDPNAFIYGGSQWKADKARQDLASRDAAAMAQAQREIDAAAQARGMQADLYGQYGALARGEGPSLARAQMAAGLDQAQRQASQQAASVRGGAGNQLIAQRMAQQTGAGLASQAAAQGAQLRMQEQLGALEAQAGLAGAIRQGDLSGRGLSEQRAAGALDAQQRMEEAQLRAQMARAGGEQQASMWAQEQNIASEQARKDRKQKFIGDLQKNVSEGFGKASGGAG
jgi:hypothetical protein